MPMLPGFTPTPFSILVKPRGPICNLDCAYCYYLSKEQLYPGSTFRMSDELLDSYIRQYIASQPGPEVIFAWQGGEPTLMGLDFYRRAVALQRRYCPPGKFISNTLQTNGLFLDDAWCGFFKQHDFLIGLSLDGPQAMHDAYRLDKGGKPTFKRVMAGLRQLQAHQVQYNILTTVHAANAPYPLEVYRFLRDDAGAEFIQFIPIVERRKLATGSSEQPVTERSVGGKQYGEFLVAVFDEWTRRDVGKVYVQLFDVALGVWYGQPASLCVFAETCGSALAMEHNGDLYACDHFVQAEYYLGNIQEKALGSLARSAAQREFGQAKRDRLPKYCRECPVRFICNGGCPKNRFILTPEGEPGLNYLCEGYKTFFTHIDEAMRFMAAELHAGRPPANVMRYFARKKPKDRKPRRAI
jgi:uncharacterized protein